jgi:hypothetical protein
VSAVAAAPSGFDKPAGLVSLGRSLAINLIGPWLIYVLLERMFPSPSRIPLWASAAVPTIDLLWVLYRKRRIDVPAAISMAQLSLAVAISLFVHDPRQAMAGHALQPAAQGLVFLVSMLMGRPLIVLLARQAICGDDPVRQARFDAAVATHPAVRRGMTHITLAWTLALCGETVARLAILQRTPVSTYLFIAHLMSYVVPAAMIWASMRYGRSLRAQATATTTSSAAAGSSRR